MSRADGFKAAVVWEDEPGSGIRIVQRGPRTFAVTLNGYTLSEHRGMEKARGAAIDALRPYRAAQAAEYAAQQIEDGRVLIIERTELRPGRILETRYWEPRGSLCRVELGAYCPLGGV